MFYYYIFCIQWELFLCILIYFLFMNFSIIGECNSINILPEIFLYKFVRHMLTDILKLILNAEHLYSLSLSWLYVCIHICKDMTKHGYHLYDANSLYISCVLPITRSLSPPVTCYGRHTCRLVP